MVIVERQRLLPVARIFRVIEVENAALWRTGKAGNELFNEGLADAVDVLAAGGMFKARDGRTRGQRGIIVKPIWRSTPCSKTGAAPG